jgi:hypothetical protein
MAFGWIGSTNGVGCRGQEAIDQMRPQYRLRFGAPVALEFGPDASDAVSGRSSLRANQTTSFFLVSAFSSGAYSAKLLNGTKHRFSGLSQARQCGEDAFLMFVTGYPLARGRSGCAVFPGANLFSTWDVNSGVLGSHSRRFFERFLRGGRKRLL